MTPAYTPAYVAEALADEMTLAVLLGWTPSTVQAEPSPTVYLKGSKGCTFGSAVGSSTRPSPSGWMPQWRRSWAGAGELIARCQLLISTGPASVMVASGDNDFEICSHYAQHPTPDDAIRSAMCAAAIAYLSKERGA